MQSIIKACVLLSMTAIFSAEGEKCSCFGGSCCSRFGFCGTGEDFCGIDCRGGPCYYGGFPVANWVTDAFFSSIIGGAPNNCPGKTFYSRSSFISALDSNKQFGQMRTSDDSKREIAAFFAHVTHETAHMCYVEEVNGASRNYCNASYSDYPCTPGKSYHGRGPIQLTWNYNYGGAGKDLGFDGLNAPERVATDKLISFKAALWFWMTNVHSKVTQGFGATIRAVNYRECGGGNSAAVDARVGYYQDYCSRFGVSPGANLRC